MEQKSFQEDWELAEAEQSATYSDQVADGSNSEATGSNAASTARNGSSSCSDTSRGSVSSKSVMDGNVITSTPAGLASSLHGLPLHDDASMPERAQNGQLEPSTPPPTQRATSPYT